MRAIHFLQVDLCLTKTQNRSLILFVVIAIMLSIMQGTVYWGPLYMVFGSIILSTTPFTISQKSNNGFLLMLPATKTDRVAGRFGYGVVLLLISLVFSSISVFFVSIKENIDIFRMVPFYIVIIAAGLILISLQYTLLYIIGEVKSQQVMGIIRIVPGFLFFFGGSLIMDFINKHNTEEQGENFIKWLNNWLIWMFDHLLECSLIVLLVGIVIFIAGIFVSVQVIKRRDFA